MPQVYDAILFLRNALRKKQEEKEQKEWTIVSSLVLSWELVH